MKKTTLIIIGIFLINLAYSQTASPELISSAGDSFTNSSTQLDWSIGECVTMTFSSESNQLTQGFYQGNYDISTLIDKFQNNGICIDIYPNPASDLISINFPKVEDFTNSSFVLTNINGKVLVFGKLIEREKQLNFSNYSKGMYLLSIKQDNKTIKSFKIIKN